MVMMMMMMMMMMINCFCGMVDRRKTSALFPTETITRGTHHRKSTRREQDFNLYKLDLTLMKFCSSDNLYTTAPQVFFPFSISFYLFN